MTGAARWVIVAAGGTLAPDALRALLRPGDRLVAADGGADLLAAAGAHPEVVIGDLDSISPGLAQSLETGADGISLIRHPVRKDATDAELALAYTLGEADARAEILMVGVFGDRIDHGIGIIGVLAGLPEATRRRITLSDGRQCAYVVGTRRVLYGRPGDTVSVLPMTPRVAGVTLEGFSFPLRDGTLTWGNTLGVSNHLEGPEGRITIRGRGVALVIHTLDTA